MNFQKIEKILAKALTPKRFAHSVGVSETAVVLAKRFGADFAQAALAGLLHDCAREIPNHRLLQAAAMVGITADEIETAEPLLLHAPLGARMAQSKYGIDDAAVCRAIALHTVGGLAMSVLDKVIYLADFIEPGREFPGVEALRRIAAEDLDKAVLAAYDQTLQHIVEKGLLLHPATVAGRNALLLQLK